MAKLTAAKRNAMPAKEFAGPDRTFPIPDKSHDRAALSGVARKENMGTISSTTAAKIRREAKVKLGNH